MSVFTIKKWFFNPSQFHYHLFWNDYPSVFTIIHLPSWDSSYLPYGAFTKDQGRTDLVNRYNNLFEKIDECQKSDKVFGYEQIDYDGGYYGLYYSYQKKHFFVADDECDFETVGEEKCGQILTEKQVLEMQSVCREVIHIVNEMYTNPTATIKKYFIK